MVLHVWMARRATADCTHSSKKLRLKFMPDRTYLLVTVINMEDAQ